MGPWVCASTWANQGVAAPSAWPSQAWPSRLRWAFKGMKGFDPGLFAGHVAAAGLEVQRRRYLGPIWSAARATDLDPAPSTGLAARLRMASLVVARRRDPGLTPLRAIAPVLKFRPGMSAG